MSEKEWDWGIDQEEFETSYEDYNITDNSNKTIINEILEMSFLEEQLKKLPGYKKPRYYQYPYEDRSLYSYSKAELLKILKNMQNKLLSIIWNMGYRPSYKPHIYKYYPKDVVKYPYKNHPFYKYYHKYIAPFKILSNIGITPWKQELSVDSLDNELLHFTITNMEYLSELETLHLQYLLETKMRKEELIKLVRNDMLRRFNVEPQLKNQIEDEILKFELTHATPHQQEQLRKLYARYQEVMDFRKQTEEKQARVIEQLAKIRSEQIRRLKEGKPLKKKETLGEDSARLLCKALSSQTRSEIIKKAQEELKKKKKEKK